MSFDISCCKCTENIPLIDEMAWENSAGACKVFLFEALCDLIFEFVI